MSTLWCEVCRKYKDKIEGMRNYTGVWVAGSTNHKTSNIVDQATNDQHLTSMQHFDSDRKKARGTSLEDYSPLVQSMTWLFDSEKARLKNIFDFCYMLARESLVFVKYAPIHECQGTNLGKSYKTLASAKVFTHYIAEVRQSILVILSILSLLAFLWMGPLIVTTLNRSSSNHNLLLTPVTPSASLVSPQNSE